MLRSLRTGENEVICLLCFPCPEHLQNLYPASLSSKYIKSGTATAERVISSRILEKVASERKCEEQRIIIVEGGLQQDAAACLALGGGFSGQAEEKAWGCTLCQQWYHFMFWFFTILAKHFHCVEIFSIIPTLKIGHIPYFGPIWQNVEYNFTVTLSG